MGDKNIDRACGYEKKPTVGCYHNVRDDFFTTTFPVTSAFSARLTAFAVPARSSNWPGPSTFAWPDGTPSSSSVLNVMNLSSLDTGGGIGRRVGWKNRP